MPQQTPHSLLPPSKKKGRLWKETISGERKTRRRVSGGLLAGCIQKTHLPEGGQRVQLAVQSVCSHASVRPLLTALRELS